MIAYKRRFTCLLVAALLGGSIGSAQYVKDYLKIADNYYKKADYYSAAQYYEKYLNNLSGKKTGQYDPYTVKLLAEKAGLLVNRTVEVMYRAADCYRELNFPAKAAPFYEQVLQTGDSSYALANYYYGTSLRALEKYAEAESAIRQFLETGAKPQFQAAATRELENLVYIRSQLQRDDLHLFAVQKAGGQMNPGGANYAPVLVNQHTLLFTSTRTLEPGAAKGHDNRLFRATINTIDSAAIEPLALDAVMPHQGAAAVSADGNTLYFTGWEQKGTTKTASLFCSVKTDGKWAQPLALPAPLNQPGSNNQQPYLTADGRFLLFASDRAGGQGGFDIWYASIDAAGNIGTPLNAGVVLNTTADEQAPYYHMPSQTVVFTTNGRIGMGGFDLFYSKGDFAAGQWQTPQNFGFPVNSVKDDMYLVSGATGDNILDNVWLSSDRTAACCLELFTLAKKTPPPPPVIVKADPEVPVVKEDTTSLVGTSQVLKNVYFEYNKAVLLDSSSASLDELVTLLQKYPAMEIEIGGHTDNKGTDVYNQRLSQQRAQSCVNYIVGKGIAASRMTAKGYGATQPVAPNTNEDGSDNPEGRQLNRRTEFTILKQ